MYKKSEKSNGRHEKRFLKFILCFQYVSLRFYKLHYTSSETYASGRGNATMKQLKIAITLLSCKNSCKNFEEFVTFF